MSGSAWTGNKLYFCEREGRRKSQEWGKSCKGRLYGIQNGWDGETKGKLGLNKIKLLLPSLKCVLIYYYHDYEQNQDYVDLSIKLAT